MIFLRFDPCYLAQAGLFVAGVKMIRRTRFFASGTRSQAANEKKTVAAILKLEN